MQQPKASWHRLASVRPHSPPGFSLWSCVSPLVSISFSFLICQLQWAVTGGIYIAQGCEFREDQGGAWAEDVLMGCLTLAHILLLSLNSTKRVDHSNTRLVTQLDRNPGG